MYIYISIHTHIYNRDLIPRVLQSQEALDQARRCVVDSRINIYVCVLCMCVLFYVFYVNICCGRLETRQAVAHPTTSHNHPKPKITTTTTKPEQVAALMARVVVEPPVKQAAVQLIAELVQDEEVSYIDTFICFGLYLYVYVWGVACSWWGRRDGVCEAGRGDTSLACFATGVAVCMYIYIYIHARSPHIPCLYYPHRCHLKR